MSILYINLSLSLNFAFSCNIPLCTGKSESIWDRFVHEKPEQIYGGVTGDTACDSYNKYKTDIELMKDIGVSSIMKIIVF